MTVRIRPMIAAASVAATLLLSLLSGARLSAQESRSPMMDRAAARCPCRQPGAAAARAACGMMGRRNETVAPDPEAVAPEPNAVAPEPEGPTRGLTVAPSPARGATVFRGRCTACHGAEGRGDGPAAAWLRPRPPDLTRSARVRSLTETELLRFLRAGRGSMPAFGRVLTERQLGDLVAWLREENGLGAPGRGAGAARRR
jgi:mono/diheme cytochrome c family protein